MKIHRLGLPLLFWLLTTAASAAVDIQQEQHLGRHVLDAAKSIGISLPETIPANWRTIPTPKPSSPPARGMADVSADAFYAAGLGEKRIYMVPSLDLVAMGLGPGSSTWDDNAFLGPICNAAQ